MKRLKINEKQKLIGLITLFVISVAVFILFLFKLPSTKDYHADAVSDEMESIAIEEGKVYQQTFKCEVNYMTTAALLFLREGNSQIPGYVIIEIFDKNQNLIGRNKYEANMIPDLNFVNVFFDNQDGSLGKTYFIRVTGQDIGNHGLQLAVSEGKKEQLKGSIDGKKMDEKFLTSYIGKKGDVTFFWYIIMFWAMLLPAFVMIDYSKVKEGGRKNG